MRCGPGSASARRNWLGQEPSEADCLRARLIAHKHLDREGGHPGQLAAPLESGVQVGRLDDREPAQVLLALGERAVGREHLAVGGPDHGGRVRREQPAGPGRAAAVA
jgi:hypothetical protein